MSNVRYAGLVAAIFAAVAPAAAYGQEGEPVAPIATPRELPTGRLFISPMGQPFRETAGQPGPPIVAWFRAADTDGDSKLSRAEFVDQAMAFFSDVLDANHDQLATSAESTQLWREQAPEMLSGETPTPRPAPRPPRIGGGAEPRNDGRIPIPTGRSLIAERERPPGIERFGITSDREPVMSCDVDLNRRVTPEEFRACAERRFDALDVNGDGYFEIGESERAQALARR